VLVTSSLLIHGQNAGYGPLLVARNKETGEEIATIEIPANPSGAPMSYAVDGRQYIAISVGSTPVPELVVYALP
jgi:quinoprotein glucose dehydrogenase